ncbi:hypothetical protein MtrunA17_Chr7g0233791 [Medicago truncatula]|uniref:Transmembrane protein n=1 Tax=Medicago truncatula TaxID=3880 RepID=A0A396H1T1_MEDTR|nr:hypothetical protein MtrunA17_Chr7g0233791 [Medicago truncatula]
MFSFLDLGFPFLVVSNGDGWLLTTTTVGSAVKTSDSVPLDLSVVLDHDCSVARGCSSFTINPPSQLPDRCRRKDRGGFVVVVCAGLFKFSFAFCLFGCQTPSFCEISVFWWCVWWLVVVVMGVLCLDSSRVWGDCCWAGDVLEAFRHVCREWCCRAAAFGDVQVVVMEDVFVAYFLVCLC